MPGDIDDLADGVLLLAYTGARQPPWLARLSGDTSSTEKRERLEGTTEAFCCEIIAARGDPNWSGTVVRQLPVAGFMTEATVNGSAVVMLVLRLGKPT